MSVLPPPLSPYIRLWRSFVESEAQEIAATADRPNRGASGHFITLFRPAQVNAMFEQFLAVSVPPKNQREVPQTG
jgi:hypothetical protein